jgi:N-acetylglucosaminyldiphosphoundecaprenol N-acetyl-beta-D-mannosaminyltransferase
MSTYFNVNLEFDYQIIHNKINDAIQKNLKGYVCVVDGNVLAFANQNEYYRTIVNSSFINTCDGSSIAFLAGKIHRKKLVTYTGPDLFEYFSKQKYKQYLLGNTNEVMGL